MYNILIVPEFIQSCFIRVLMMRADKDKTRPVRSLCWLRLVYCSQNFAKGSKKHAIEMSDWQRFYNDIVSVMLYEKYKEMLQSVMYLPGGGVRGLATAIIQCFCEHNHY